MLSGLLGSGVGLLGRTEATSKVAADVALADGGSGAWADAVVAVNRVTRAKIHLERMLVVMS
jgi:hypothetical protein